MLPRGSRLKASADFRMTIRRGVRVGRPTLVLHLQASTEAGSPRAGLVVSKTVGNAVTRNRVKRRLRHLARPLLTTTPAGVDVVVRALPAAAGSASLDGDLRSAWQTGLRRLGPMSTGSGSR